MKLMPPAATNQPDRGSGSGQRKAEDDMNDMRKLIEKRVAAYVPDD